MGALKKPVPIAFSFVLDELYSLEPRVRPMFGCHAVYVGEKMVLILRNRDSYENDNGVWVAIGDEHQSALKKLIPSLRPVEVLGANVKSAWRNIPADSTDFEERVMQVCEMILKNDPRIGKIPKSKKKKN